MPGRAEAQLLYEVRVGQDCYVGTADEVVAFMARAEGAPGQDPESYMRGVAEQLAARMGLDDIDTSEAAAFLDDLDRHGVLPIQTRPEPSNVRIDKADAVGSGPVVYGPGVEPGDVDLDEPEPPPQRP